MSGIQIVVTFNTETGALGIAAPPGMPIGGLHHPPPAHRPVGRRAPGRAATVAGGWAVSDDLEAADLGPGNCVLCGAARERLSTGEWVCPRWWRERNRMLASLSTPVWKSKVEEEL